MKYNYVIYSAEGDYIRAMLQDLDGKNFVEVCDDAFLSGGRLCHLLFKLHFSAKINSRIRLPLKRLWFKRMTKHGFDNDKPICRVSLGGKYLSEYKEFTDWLKRTYPNDKSAIVYLDQITKKRISDFDAVKRSCDLVFSYDPIEAKEYDVEFLPYFFGKSGLLEFRGEPENDVYFVGYAKDRLPEILAAYRALTERQLRCDFRIVGVNECDRVYVEGIKYSGQIPYEQATREMLNAKCILDVTQKGAAGPSLRVAESILYHRKLLSDNAALLDSYMYNPEHMLVFSSVGDAEAEFVKAPLSNEVYRDSDIMSSVELLEFIDNKL